MRSKALFRTGWAAMLLLALSIPAAAQDERGEGKLDPSQPKGITVQEIIQRFATKEKEFKLAREKYTYTQDETVQTIDGDTVTGEFRLVFDVLFDAQGRRIQQVAFAPQSTLEQGGISMSKEDMSDLENLLPFVLTSDEIPEYDILYAGQQREDALNTYVFDIAPKKIEKDRRYFQGRIWVDNQDFMIVKTEGKTVPDIRPKKGQENLFPKFTTWRQQVDGQYWFPVYTRADDILHFKTQDTHIREIVKYKNYKRFGASTVITYQGQEVQKGTDKPQETKKQIPPK